MHSCGLGMHVCLKVEGHVRKMRFNLLCDSWNQKTAITGATKSIMTAGVDSDEDGEVIK